MKPPLYREALAHSWHLAWKEHGLWPFGLFASVLGQMGIVDALVQLWFTARGYQPGSGLLVLLDLFHAGFSGQHIPFGLFGWIAFLCTVFLSFGVVLTFLAVVSQGAVVHSTAYLVHHKRVSDTRISWHAGITAFWRVFTIHLLKRVFLLVVGLMVALVSWPILFSLGGSPVFFLLIFLLAAGISLIVSIMAVYAVGYIVVEEYTFFQAIVAAWQLFAEHWLVSLEVGCVIFVLDIFISFFMITLLFVSFIPAFVAYLLALLFSSSLLFTLGIALSAIVFLLFLFTVASVFSLFTTATWTYLFMQMHKTGLKSHIMHWLGR